jgi:hypothetical protein
MQDRIDTSLETTAAAGRTAKESTAATMHRQPTPSSMAAAEQKLGEVQAKTADAVEQAMARARAADLAGNKSGCEGALADAQRALGD